jgi:hypothetical protein
MSKEQDDLSEPSGTNSLPGGSPPKTKTINIQMGMLNNTVVEVDDENRPTKTELMGMWVTLDSLDIQQEEKETEKDVQDRIFQAIVDHLANHVPRQAGGGVNREWPYKSSTGGVEASIRYVQGDVIYYYQFHPTWGPVPRPVLEEDDDGHLKLGEEWPSQEDVGGVWIIPHILPDGHTTPMAYVEPSLPEGFRMGDSESPPKDRRTVHVPGGFMGLFPTTVEEWNWFCAATGRDKKPTTVTRGEMVVDVTHHPVVNVSFHDAVAFTTWAQFGIPTEEEWERAARGNDGRQYPWGNESPNDELCCSSITTPKAGTDPVDAHPKGRSPYGIYDMSGNVWEWTGTYF